MPARSQVRQRAAGAAPSATRGKSNTEDLRPPAKSPARSMSEKEFEKMAFMPRHGKPEQKHDA
ncbi:DUF3008 family protein [Burkholderia lata]|nr:DUF3008 family protein [Burkholderia lata]